MNIETNDRAKERATDPNDRASEQEEQMREAAMRLRKPEGPKATGKCLCCDAVLPIGMRWCDSSCRDDWQAEQR